MHTRALQDNFMRAGLMAAGFWLPGGGNDSGEGLAACAVRECEEEAGVVIQLKGLLEVRASFMMSAYPSTCMTRATAQGWWVWKGPLRP